MESKIPTVEKNKDGYIRVRLLECLQELELSLLMLKEGFSRNSAGKAFIAWKAFISALVALNLDKMYRDEKEKEWYYKTGFLAPIKGLKGISQRLEELGYEVVDTTSTALTLHRYVYNGLYKGASDYADRDEAVNDILHLVNKTLALLKEYFKDRWNEEMEALYRKVEEELKDLTGKKSVT
ncbi:PaREP1 family protein [Acidianus sp. HS-5]|uniref:PaREP1 family protein n=1 Tax=Acidianus sp. HS-5 TaxID=2886040 RepID=UPI001F2372C8|nr:PaREP1 family protein [Acidianus sp. HS-5]